MSRLFPTLRTGRGVDYYSTVLIFFWGAYLQPHFGHLVGGAFAVLFVIVNLGIFVSSDS